MEPMTLIEFLKNMGDITPPPAGSSSYTPRLPSVHVVPRSDIIGAYLLLSFHYHNLLQQSQERKVEAADVRVRSVAPPVAVSPSPTRFTDAMASRLLEAYHKIVGPGRIESPPLKAKTKIEWKQQISAGDPRVVKYGMSVPDMERSVAKFKDFRPELLPASSVTVLDFRKAIPALKKYEKVIETATMLQVTRADGSSVQMCILRGCYRLYRKVECVLAFTSLRSDGLIKEFNAGNPVIMELVRLFPELLDYGGARLDTLLRPGLKIYLHENFASRKDSAPTETELARQHKVRDESDSNTLAAQREFIMKKWTGWTPATYADAHCKETAAKREVITISSDSEDSDDFLV